MSISIGQLRQHLLHPLLPPIAALAMGGLISTAAWLLAGHYWDLPSAQGEINALGESRRGLAQEALNDVAQTMDLLAGVFGSADHEISRSEFESLSKGLIPRVLEWGQISWAPLVTRGMRAPHEVGASNEGLAGYRIVERQPDGSLAVAADHDRYFPILYSGGSADIPVTLGFDIGSDGAERTAMDEARDSGRLVATPLSELHIGTLSLPGIALLMPVYKHDKPQGTVEERRSNLAGFVRGFFAPSLIIEGALREVASARGVDMLFFAADAPAELPFYVLESRLRGSPATPLPQARLETGLHWSGELTLGTAKWTIVVAPIPSSPLVDENNRARIVLVAGLLLTGLISAYLYAAGCQRRRLLTALDQLASSHSLLESEIAERRRATRELAFSNTVLLAAEESSPDGMLVVDENARIISSNRRFAEMWRVPQQLIDEGIDEHVRQAVRTRIKDPVSFARRVEHLYAHPEERSHDRIELTDERIFERETQSLYDAEGKYLGRIWFFRDVTERERAEEETRQSEEKFRSVAEVAQDAIVTIDASDRIAYWNPAAERMFGYTAAEAIGKKMHDWLAPERFRDDAAAGLKEFARTGRGRVIGKTLELAAIRKDGSEFPLELSLAASRVGGMWSAIGIIRDITERKQVEAKLHESRQLINSVLNTVGGARIFWKDKNLVYLGCNATFAHDAGFTRPDEIIGKNDYAMGWRDQAELYRADDREVIESGRNKLLIEEPQTTPEGETITLLTNKVPLRNARGEVIGVLGTYMDVTERKRAEEKLRTSEAQLSNALQMARAGHWEYDVAADRFTFNDNFYRIFRTTAEEVGGYTLSSGEYARRFVHPDDLAVVGTETKAAIETTDPHYSRELEHRIIYADGSVGYMAVRFFIAKDGHGRTIKTYGVNQDITERKNALVTIEYRAALLHALSSAAASLLTGSSLEETAPEALRIVGETVRADRVAVLEAQSPSAAGPPQLAFRFGWHSSTAPVRLNAALFKNTVLPGIEHDPWFAPLQHGMPITNTASKAVGAAKALLENLQIQSILVVPMIVDGKYWGQIGFDDCRSEREWTPVEIDILRALSNLVAAAIVRERYVRELADANVIVRNSTVILYRLSGEPSLPCTYISENISLYGYDPADFRKPNYYMSLVHPDDVPVVQRALTDVLMKNAPAAMIEFRAHAKDGRTLWVEARYYPVRDATGRVIEVEGLLIDITERKIAEEKIALLARTDPLTSLANRATFLDRLRLMFAAAQRGSAPFAILYLDIDRFKDINDTLGHPVGDQLLQTLAARLKASVRETDMVARLGGDEFAVLEANIGDTADAGALAENLRRAASAPCLLDGNELHVTISVGISCYAPDVPPDVLLSQADLALYRAKEEGRDQYRFHSEELDIAVRERVSMADELRRGLDRGEFELHYQPQVEFAGGKIVGMEALIRWNHPTRGLLMPGTFIPIAEKTGTIVAIGQWVLDRACQQMSEWKAQGVAPDSLAVNLSWNQLAAGPEFVQSVADTLARWNLAPSALELDVTESIMARATFAKNDSLDQLQRLGVKIAIDDFGSQYSSLDYLKSYHVNRLKVPQNLMEAARRDSRGAAVVRAIVGIARELRVEIVAQGVETKQQWSYLTETIPNVRVQGFYYSKPVAAKRATTLLKCKYIEPAASATARRSA